MKMTIAEAVAKRCVWHEHSDMTRVLFVDGKPVVKVIPGEFWFSLDGEAIIVTWRNQEIIPQ